jgi:sirohydrochlorin cobaltochelatase
MRKKNLHHLEGNMNIAVVLAMHGVPPKDFPKRETMELFSLHHRLGHTSGEERAILQKRHDELEEKMLRWPRTPENDPFYYASLEIAQKIGHILGKRVVVGFNEFCSPTVEEAIDEAVSHSVEKVIIITPMMTRGGEHSEKDIPRAIGRSREKHPHVEMIYAWPFDTTEVAAFLADHARRFL